MNTAPPQWPLKLLRSVLKDELVEEIEGDLLEFYQEWVRTHGKKRANRLYLIHALKFFRPFALKQIFSFKTQPLMFSNHIKVAIRSFARYKTTFVSNLIGLSFAFIGILFLYLWVRQELSTDQFHIQSENLYQLMEYAPEGDTEWAGKFTSGLLAEAIAEEMPEIDYAVPLRTVNETKVVSTNNRAFEARVVYAGRDFFKAFSFDLQEGEVEGVLENQYTMAISEELAGRLFQRKENVVGELLTFEYDTMYAVSGVFKKGSEKSSLQFDLVLPFERYKSIRPSVLDWNYNTTNTFAVLKEDVDAVAFQDKIADFLVEKRDGSPNKLFIQRFEDTYLRDAYKNGQPSGGKIAYIRLLILIGVLVLTIACINFVNLFTAQASRRFKEIGVRKAMGAQPQSLILQYLSEAFLMVFFSFFVALLFLVTLRSSIETLMGMEFTLKLDLSFWILIASIIVTTTVLAGTYPALYLSSLRPVNVLKGKVSASLGQLWVRKGLIITQFLVATTLILGSLIIKRQIDYLQSKDLGYEKAQLISLEMKGKISENLDVALSEISSIPGIASASSIGQNLVNGTNTIEVDDWEGKQTEQKLIAEMRPVHHGMIEMLKLEMIEGRSFSKDFSTEGDKIIINNAAAKAMGLNDPIGKKILIQNHDLEIVGVTKDFHYASLHERIGPLFFILRPSWTHKLIVEVAQGQNQEAIEALEAFHTDFNPGFPFAFEFVDEAYNRQYRSEQQIQHLTSSFTILAVVLASIGLIGLASFVVEKRKKELSIRKILGATLTENLISIGSSTVSLVIYASLLALPIGYFAAREWLQNFAYSTSLPWWLFGMVTFSIFVLSCSIVGLNIIKVSRDNPIAGLKAD